MNIRGRRASPPPSHDRWLVSYADFITLLFALFVVLFAASNADKEKVHKFAQAVQNAIEHSGMGRVGGVPLRQPPQEPALNSTYLALARSLQPEVREQSGKSGAGREGTGNYPKSNCILSLRRRGV